MKIVNRENIIDAINEGINAETIQDTIVLLDSRYSNLSYIPKQFKTIIDGVCALKQDVVSDNNSEYSSTFFKENSSKLKAAINDGISSSEIVNYFNNTDINLCDNTIRLISGLKGREKRINLSREKGYQKKLLKEDK